MNDLTLDLSRTLLLSCVHGCKRIGNILRVLIMFYYDNITASQTLIMPYICR